MFYTKEIWLTNSILLDSKKNLQYKFHEMIYKRKFLLSVTFGELVCLFPWRYIQHISTVKSDIAYLNIEAI